MQASTIPVKIDIAWATSAGTGFIRSIPDTSQIGITAGEASWPDGFPPVTFQPLSSGGLPVDGRDLNGVIKQISQWTRWMCAGGPIYYDNTFAIAIGGYPVQTVLSCQGTIGGFWLSLVDNNLVNPESAGQPDGVNWAQFNVLANSVSTGATHWRPTQEVVSGYVRCNALSVGDGFSNSTERANKDCFNIFSWVWTNFTDAICPLQLANGSVTLRGGSALADWNNHCRIATPDMRGSWPGGLDTMGNAAAGRLSTATFTVGSGSVPGSRGNFQQPNSGTSSASFQCGTWYLKL